MLYEVITLAAGSGDSTHFQPDALTTTTYFTRVVQSGDVSDTSISVKVFVFNAIAGNNLNLRDTLCYATSPGTLSTGVLSGGNGSYSYRWQADTEGGNWLSRGTNASLVESTLTESTYYRCIVTSARVCIDTSAADTITILPSISQNTFPLAYSDTAVCAGLDAGTIRPGQPAGGEAGNYHYQWLEGVSAISFVPLPMATGMNYSPGVVPASRYYT